MLRRAKDLVLNIRQWRQVGESLGTVAIRLTFALRCRQEILTAGRRRRYAKIIVRLGTAYDYPDDQPPTPHDEENVVRDEGEDEHFQRQAEVQALLELANQVEDIVSMYSSLRNMALSVFFRQLNRLKIALLKQLKDLEGRLQIPITKIEVVSDWDESQVEEDDNNW
jgi:hypothetical protein